MADPATVGVAAVVVAKPLVEVAASFLSKICLPGAEELGLLLKDKVANWRATNAARIAELAQKRLDEKGVNADDVQAHPRIVGKIIDEGSWAESIDLQDMWAGLLASSCGADGKDESNLIFAQLLGQLTTMEAAVLSNSCRQCGKQVSTTGLLVPDYLCVSLTDLRAICNCDDIHRIDRELDHLRNLGLLSIEAGFHPTDSHASMTPSSLALHLFARCSGYQGDPVLFYGLEYPPIASEAPPTT